TRRAELWQVRRGRVLGIPHQATATRLAGKPRTAVDVAEVGLEVDLVVRRDRQVRAEALLVVFVGRVDALVGVEGGRREILEDARAAADVRVVVLEQALAEDRRAERVLA